MLIPLVIVVFGLANGVQPQQPPCTQPEFSQFDFWIGEWDVFDPSGKQVGSNSITKSLDGCFLREEWRGGGGSRGGSFNTYVRSDKRWHQAWLDVSGTMLHLRGGFSDGAMRLSNDTNRITWTPNPDGSVRQLWEAAGPDKTWKVVFDGQYRRRK